MKKYFMTTMVAFVVAILFIPNVHAVSAENGICAVTNEADLKTAASMSDCEIITATQHFEITGEVEIIGKSLIINDSLTVAKTGRLDMSGLTSAILNGRKPNNDQTNTSILLDYDATLTIEGTIVISDNSEKVEPGTDAGGTDDTTKVMAIQTVQTLPAQAQKTSKIVINGGTLTIANSPRGIGNVTDIQVDNGGALMFSSVENYAFNEAPKVEVKNNSYVSFADTVVGSENYATNIETDDKSEVIVYSDTTYVHGNVKGNVSVETGADFTLSTQANVDETSTINVAAGSSVVNNTGKKLAVKINGKDVEIETGQSYNEPKPTEEPTAKPAETNPDTSDINITMLFSMIALGVCGLGVLTKKRLSE